MEKLGDILLKNNIITKDKLEIGLKVQKLSNQLLGQILYDLDFVTSFDIAKALAQQNDDIEFIDLSNVVIEPDIVNKINYEDSKDLQILAFESSNNIIKFATANINILEIKDFLHSINILDYELYFCDQSLLSTLQYIYYEQTFNPIDKQIESIISDSHNEEIDITHLTDLLLQNAINLNATDIHLSPDSAITSVFFRIDGIMHMYYAYPYSVHKRIVSTIKVRSNMDIANTNIPQDGSMSLKYLENKYDFRVSSLPTSNGENIVIRILPKNSSLFDLGNLGFSQENKNKLEKNFLKPYGIVLIVGPTGSGKTTTLYSALRRINSIEKNILTVEDPIEYNFNFVRQTQVNNKADYTFHKALKYFMRQDPDVILVGEIRDEETANLAIRASITGHLVLSTIHANTAIDALPRLYDLDVDSSFLALGLLSIISQRLIRKLCPKCKQEFKTTTNDIFEQISYNSDAPIKDIKIFKPNNDGCTYCNNTGYKGRVAIIEIFEVSEEIKQMLVESKNISQITQKAQESGMKTLKDDAISKLFQGITSIDEINRVLN